MGSSLHSLVSLILLALSSVVGVTATIFQGVENETIILPCSLDGTNGTMVYWFSTYLNDYLNYYRDIKQSVPVIISSRLAVTGEGTDFNLEISRLTATDAGEYRCGIYGTTTAESRMPKHIKTIVYDLVVNVPPASEYPMCDVQPPGTRSIGDFVSLSCTSSGGSPPAQLAWYLGEQQLHSMQHWTNSIIFNKTLDQYDNGLSFICESTSPAYAVTRTCFVTPLSVPPTVSMVTVQSKVYSLDQVTYRCSGSGMPTVSYRWLVNSTVVPQDSTRFVLGHEGRELRILHVLPTDNGTTVTCQVITPSGLTSSYERKLVVSRRSVASCNHGISDDIIIPDQSNLPILAILVAFFGGVGLTLVVVLVIIFTCRKNKRHNIKAREIPLGSRLWSTKDDNFPTPSAEPESGVNVFAKEPVFDASSNVPVPAPQPPPRSPTGHVQKNQYFEMNSGTFQQLSATLPMAGGRNEYQLRSNTHPPPLGYENVGRGSGTDLTDVSSEEILEVGRPRIGSVGPQPPVSAIYMEPKMRNVPVPPTPTDIAQRRGYDAVPRGKPLTVKVTPKNRRKEMWEHPEYTEIDGMAQSPIRNTYETSIISRFDL